MSAVVTEPTSTTTTTRVPVRTRRTWGWWIAAGVFVIVLLTAPYWTTSVNLGKFSQVTYYATGVLSVVLLSGRLGQFSLGQGAFLGIGAYTTLLMTNAGVNWFVAIIPAAIIPMILGGIAGLPALRIRGLNLALVTMGIAIVFPQFILKFSDFSGGAAGLSADEAIPSVFGFNRAISVYWIVIVLAVIVFLISWTLVTSRTGRAMVAIRDQEIASRTLGINMKVTKVSMYAWTAAIAGVAGWMFAMTNRFAAPADFSMLLSINLVLGMIIGGGAGNIVIASVVGGLFLVYVRDFVPQIGFDPLLTPFIYGIILIIVLFFLPGGASGLVRDVSNWIGRRRAKSAPIAEVPIAHGIVEEGDKAEFLVDSRDEAPIGGLDFEQKDPVTGDNNPR